MTRPLMVDFFCCAGGAGKGYHDAGFDLVGVDNRPQPNYPYEFVQADALTLMADVGFMRQFVAAHGSPPCGSRTAGAARWGTQGNHPWLVPQTRELLTAWGGPFIVENVEPAVPDLRGPVVLCGTMFGLGVFRHRAFELSHEVALLVPPHTPHRGRVGDGTFVTVTGSTGGRSKRDGIQHGRKADWVRAMGIDWMTVAEMSQAIPPAYTQFLGEALMAAVLRRSGVVPPAAGFEEAG